jgi:hypothetical protein
MADSKNGLSDNGEYLDFTVNVKNFDFVAIADPLNGVLNGRDLRPNYMGHYLMKSNQLAIFVQNSSIKQVSFA